MVKSKKVISYNKKKRSGNVQYKKAGKQNSGFSLTPENMRDYSPDLTDRNQSWG